MNVFISYSRGDHSWLERLRAYLKPLERAGLIDAWEDTRVTPGLDRHAELQRALSSAQIAILLVSQDFLAADLIRDNEMPVLLSAAAGRGLKVLPVILRHCLFEETPVLCRFTPVNRASEPLNALSEAEQDAVLVRLAQIVLQHTDGAGQPRPAETVTPQPPTGARETPPIVAGTPPLPARSPEDDCYVPREREEQLARSLLQMPGASVLIWGPERSGKTSLLRHILQSIPPSADGTSHAVEMSMAEISRESQGGLTAFTREFAECVFRAARRELHWVDKIWRGFGGPGLKLSRLFEQHLLPTEGGRLILALDHADAIFGSPVEDDFFGFLRAWVEDNEAALWSAFRLVLVVSTTPTLLTRKRTQSPLFNRVTQIRLRDFDANQVHSLLHCYGLNPTVKDVSALMRMVGGNPFLLRLAASSAAHHGMAVRELLEDPEALRLIFSPHLSECSARLLARPELRAAVCQVLREPEGALDPEIYEELHRASFLVRERSSGYQIPYRLYEDHFRALCKSS